jgi:hypothetical protein
MTLSDVQVERYSRQILLPEVGGRGQARLLAARVAVAGAGEAAAVVATLLGRAGVGRLDVIGNGPAADAPLPDVAVAVAADAALAMALGRRAQAAGRPIVLGTFDGDRAVVATLVGRPCIGCLPPDWAGGGGTAGAAVFAAPLALALGALVASEALQVVLDPPRRGRLQAIGLAPGGSGASRLDAVTGCTVCGGTA